MGKDKKVECLGVLTSGGDCPALNATIRAVVKAATGAFGIDCVGILDGFSGLVENRTRSLSLSDASGLLTMGGTILGTSREKPQKFPVGKEILDMTQVAVDHYNELHLDGLVCLGGGGTQKNAYHLMTEGGLNVITLPKTIDNDVWGTDVTFGFDTAMTIAAEAIDRLHTTAESHHRVMAVEIMGHNAGWLTLAAGVAGGADVILIPEIPYSIEKVADAIIDRNRQGKRFSIVAVAEGVMTKEEAKEAAKEAKKGKKNKKGDDEEAEGWQEPKSIRLARQLQELTGLETRVTALGHLQRGGVPTPADRLLASRLGTRAAELASKGEFGVMVAARGEDCVPVPLEEVAGKKKVVPPDHPLVKTARLVGVCMGD
ncbi:MAG TPA: ATP-dependent 6-phosphofructokinase [Candidatus Brocadiia bacterium]|nr:ATP-dependent 6-phosphofructokinase [Candidatus Brocadiia bacterium]